MSVQDRKYDIVLWGATGFTGKLVAKYLAKTYPLEEKKSAEGVSWAIAGRNETKLLAVRKMCEDIDASCKDVDILLGDASKQSTVDDIVKQAKVIIATAGPFMKYGEPVVAACAKYGTSYTDITGEAIWIRAMIDRYGAEAKANNALIVPTCGFDSLPSDLSTFFVVNHLKAKGKEVGAVTSNFAMKGGASGGTLATMMTIMSLPKEKVGKMRDVYLLNDPKSTYYKPRDKVEPLAKDFMSMKYDKNIKSYLVPFVMAGINTRVVRRSAELLDYGKNFVYNEYQRTSGCCSAVTTLMGLGMLLMLLITRCGRKILQWFGPSPGEGPTDEQIKTNWFSNKCVGTAADGSLTVVAEMRGGDPGYGDTSKMLTESAITIAKNRDALPSGFATPAVLGQHLIDRLPRTSITLTIVDSKTS